MANLWKYSRIYKKCMKHLRIYHTLSCHFHFYTKFTSNCSNSLSFSRFHFRFFVSSQSNANCCKLKKNMLGWSQFLTRNHFLFCQFISVPLSVHPPICPFIFDLSVCLLSCFNQIKMFRNETWPKWIMMKQ